MMTSVLRRGLAGIVILSVCGCGSNNNVEVFPVRGTVKFDGKPMMGGGSIAFIPTAGQVGKGAGGRIAEDGTYVLGTYTQKDGSMPGEFAVVIFQEIFDEPANTGDGAPAQESTEKVKPEDRIPASYGRANATTLKAVVEPKRDGNQIDFDLMR